MKERITVQQRSANMKAIRSVSKLEDKISKALWKRGIRLRRNVKSLFGKPDFAIKRYRIVIFIDSCFWHVCPLHGNRPKNNQEFWEKKLNRNIERDKEVTTYYLKENWNILRIWEHDFKEDFDGSVSQIEDFIVRNKDK
ncbi:very short patch repair endonuclease [Planomicrobium okeanokoites]|uniref:Very short patch repair endonuclease n=1 Tax=Planomicrobium okeanokoites TaxID=244 RepID=A0ABV7KS01_PLAOK|nr:very short patch repair endonuclease [Planomicrobium okeanokoites]TAA70037.1 very short patch repair endonuclease [Planomicrobium okeanokoites]